MGNFDLSPALPENTQIIGGENIQAIKEFVQRQINVARCFGIPLTMEQNLRKGYLEQLKKKGINGDIKPDLLVRMQREGTNLPEWGDEYFDTRHAGAAKLHLDALKYFVKEVMPALGWKEEVNKYNIEVKTPDDINRMMELSRVLGLELMDEQQVYQYFTEKLNESGEINLPMTRNWDKVMEERRKVGLKVQESIVDSTTDRLVSGKKFNALEVAAFIDKILPEAGKITPGIRVAG